MAPVMRALVADREAPGHVTIAEVPAPVTGRGQVLVEVEAISLNRGEMRALRTAADGWRPGWDFAGTVREAPAGALPAGARVVGISAGEAWAELVAVPADWTAPIPEAVSFAQAATLPTAGLTALRTLRRAPGLLGRRVLITGASGGVGRFAVQLARRAGAHVTALITNPTRTQELRRLGAAVVVSDVADLTGRYDLIVDSMGGHVLGRLITMLDPRGVLVMFGNTLDEPTTFDVRDVYNDALVQLQGFELFFDPAPFGPDLAYLTSLVEHGQLDVQPAGQFSWGEMASALEQLDRRRTSGKLVLTLDR